MVHDIFLTMLRVGAIRISQVDLIIFDECHNAVKNDQYAQIMKEFYFHGLTFSPTGKIQIWNRPKILGLTASQVKCKIEGDLEEEVRFATQKLCDILYSKIVTAKIDENAEINDD